MPSAHAFFHSRYLFTFFTVEPFWCIYSIGHTGFLLHLTCFQCNTVIWASLVRKHRPKLEVDFIFHVVFSSIETFQTLAWKFLLWVLQKIFGVYIFPNFVLVQYTVIQKLVKANPRRLNIFCLFLLFAGGMYQTYQNKLNALIITCQSNKKNTNQIYLNYNVVK